MVLNAKNRKIHIYENTVNLVFSFFATCENLSSICSRCSITHLMYRECKIRLMLISYNENRNTTIIFSVTEIPCEKARCNRNALKSVVKISMYFIFFFFESAFISILGCRIPNSTFASEPAFPVLILHSFTLHALQANISDVIRQNGSVRIPFPIVQFRCSYRVCSFSISFFFHISFSQFSLHRAVNK